MYALIKEKKKVKLRGKGVARRPQEVNIPHVCINIPHFFLQRSN